MSSPEPTNERLAIEADALRFLREFERRSARGATAGCAWFLFVVFVGITQRSANGFVVWMFMSVVALVLLGVYLRAQARRTRESFQRTFPARAGETHAREIALRYFQSMTGAKGASPNTTARKLLRTLGAEDVQFARAKEIVREIAADGRLLPPIAFNIPQLQELPRPVRTVQRDVNVPVAEAMPIESHASPALSSTRAPAQPTPQSSASESHAAPMPATPIANVSEPASVLGPVPQTASKSAPTPPATTSTAPGDLVDWRCDSCGSTARVTRAELNRLCPTCFPQIRLDV